MNFQPDEEQRAIVDLAARLMSGVAPVPGRASPGEPFDAALWRAVADAGLLGIAVPAESGGAGLGFVELCLVLEQMGRTLAPLPFLATQTFAVLPLAQFGSDCQRRELLPSLLKGGLVATGVLGEADTARPLARRHGDGWQLSGTLDAIPYGLQADLLLLAAETEVAGPLLCFVDAAGTRREPQDTTSGRPLARLRLDGIAVPGHCLLGAPGTGGRIFDWIRERHAVALAAVQLGVAGEALRRTIEHLGQRRQFGRPIGSFQSAQHRVADGYMDIEALRSAVLLAAHRLAAQESAADAVWTATWWACRAGERVANSALYQHGGLGVDLDYPIHRFFLQAKENELALGGRTAALWRLGGAIAAGTTRSLAGVDG